MKRAARIARDGQVAAAYQRQPSLRTLARLFGLSHEGIRKILIARGVRLAPVGKPIAGSGAVTLPRLDACVGRPGPSGAAAFSSGGSPKPTVESPGRLPSPADRGGHV